MDVGERSSSGDGRRSAPRRPSPGGGERSSAGRRPQPGPPTAPAPVAARAATPPADDFFSRDPEEDDEPRRRQRLRESPTLRRRVRGGLKLLVTALVVAVVAALLRTVVLAPYYIPSASMEPTLHGCPGCNNDHVLVDKLSYHMHAVHRGDVVVFHRPATWQVPEPVLIKRVIAVGGDTLSLREGRLLVNGDAIDEPYVNRQCPSLASLTESPKVGVVTSVTVPRGDLFVMGDNRCDSADSRAFGPVPDSDVIGRAFVIIWPWGRIHLL